MSYEPVNEKQLAEMRELFSKGRKIKIKAPPHGVDLSNGRPFSWIDTMRLSVGKEGFISSIGKYTDGTIAFTAVFPDIPGMAGQTWLIDPSWIDDPVMAKILGGAPEATTSGSPETSSKAEASPPQAENLLSGAGWIALGLTAPLLIKRLLRPKTRTADRPKNVEAQVVVEEKQEFVLKA